MGKLVWFAAGAAVGFVFGTRAGRQTYEDMVAGTRKLMEHPAVQEAAGLVQAQAARLYDEGLRKLNQQA